MARVKHFFVSLLTRLAALTQVDKHVSKAGSSANPMVGSSLLERLEVRLLYGLFAFSLQRKSSYVAVVMGSLHCLLHLFIQMTALFR